MREALDARDWERAHAVEDELMRLSVRASADGKPYAKALAGWVREVNELDYPRWMA